MVLLNWVRSVFIGARSFRVLHLVPHLNLYASALVHLARQLLSLYLFPIMLLNCVPSAVLSALILRWSRLGYHRILNVSVLKHSVIRRLSPWLCPTVLLNYDNCCNRCSRLRAFQLLPSQSLNCTSFAWSDVDLGHPDISENTSASTLTEMRISPLENPASHLCACRHFPSKVPHARP